ncbi:MAG: biopolymer transport protein ExbB, partial [Myxococcota bacterium]
MSAIQGTAPVTISVAALVSALAACLILAPVAFAQDEGSEATGLAEQPKSPEPTTLDDLLGMVKDGFIAESSDNKAREDRFLAAKDDQQGLLDQALAVLADEEAKSQ